MIEKIFVCFMILRLFNLNMEGQSSCDSFCYGREIYPYSAQILNVEKVWEGIDLVTARQQPLVGDIDGDGEVEIVMPAAKTSSLISNEILIFKYNQFSSIKSIKTPFFGVGVSGSILLADINNDCKLEFIIACSDDISNPPEHRKKLVCLDHNGNIMWVSDQTYAQNVPNALPNGGALGAADFNLDGIVEVYIYNEVYNAQNGIKLVDGGANGCGIGRIGVGLGNHSASTAANLDLDENLELASGYSVYKVNISNLNGTIGNSMTPFNLDFNGSYLDGFTSIADVNLDGKLDIIVSPSIKFDLIKNIDVGIYCYTIENNQAKLLAKIGIYKNNTTWEASGMVSALYNKDYDRMDLFCSIYGNNLNEIVSFSFDGTETLIKNWDFPIYDANTFSAISLFDLQNDGEFEILYRDQDSFKIINYINNVPFLTYSHFCDANTWGECPVIADIDNTGQAKICIPCATDPIGSYGYITIFGAPPGQRWAPSRKIWNQYAYNPLFINDDGSVPQFQKNHAIYQNGKYNNFMVQESLIDDNGFYPVPAASLTTSVDCIDFDPATGLYTATFQIQNSPSASLNADPALPITFYTGNPSNSGSLLGTYRTTTSILPGDTISNLTFSFPYSGSSTSLFVLVNSEKPSPFIIDSSAYLIAECDYNDNVFQAILPAFDIRNAEICSGETITFYGDMLTDSGIYYHEIPDALGCDSIIVRLELEVSQVKNEALSINACDAYTWNGTTYTSGGTFTYQTLSVNGCDSITTLTLQVNQSNNTIIERQACDSIIWNGATYDNSGFYIYMTTNIYNCDSTETLNLTIYPSSQKNINFTTCEAYTWNGQTYTQSGIYSYPSKNIYGCDSITTLNLTIHPTITETIQETQCDAYTWNGTTYTESGSYDYQTLSVLNCDSIATLALTIHPSSQEAISYSSCDPYLWNGTTYTESGTYSYKTQNIFGCDSTTTLDLTILPSSDNTTTQTACDTYTWSGTTYDQSGTYTTTSTNVFGCDSISTLNLTIHPSQNISTTETACASFLWQGTEYNQSGIYTYQTQNTFGCDSTITLNLTIHPESNIDITTTACDSLIYQGQTITESGTYTFNLQNTNGCDSTINLNLTISADRNENTQSACGSYLWSVTGEAYTQSGTYQALYTNAQGCDSTYRLDLTIHPDYNQETTAEACAKYLWPLNNQTYTQSGQHSVTLRTSQGCDSIITLDVTIHPEFEYRDTIITNEPYLWPINNTTYETSGIYTETFSTDVRCDSIHYLYLTISIDTDIHVPNIISPDGPNSQFTFYGSSISIIQNLSVYDRWGNQVFQRNSFPPNDSTQGWDGTYEGKNLTPGVYTYSAQLLLTDGTIISKYGDVTIIR